MEESLVEGLSFCVVAGEHLSLRSKVGPAPKGKRQGLGGMICESRGLPNPRAGESLPKQPQAHPNIPQEQSPRPCSPQPAAAHTWQLWDDTKTRASTACARPCSFPAAPGRQNSGPRRQQQHPRVKDSRGCASRAPCSSPVLASMLGSPQELDA